MDINEDVGFELEIEDNASNNNVQFNEAKSNYQLDDLLDENINNQRSSILDIFLNDEAEDSRSQSDSVLFIS